MAEQLNHTNSEVVYFDFSRTSMSIAQYRTKMRGWLKIVWVMDWIESIPRLGLGNFDFVVSTGVLHHLKSSQNGLNIISGLQQANGGAEIMVYGTYGRTPIYWIQKLVRILNEKENSINDGLMEARHILDILPKDHFFHALDIIDHKTMGNTGIYDLLLHKRDVSFTTHTVYQWLKKSGYNIVGFSQAENTLPISLKSTIEEQWLLKKISRSTISTVHEIGEIISSTIITQDLYQRCWAGRLDLFCDCSQPPTP